ncbi:MAG: hypothetical protein JNK15_13300 [Planctomycetes bacterium]|nr:hypothetical protein [Planctomycetota bacterium]
MTRTTCLLLAVAAVCGDLLAQSNERGPNYNASLTNISGVTDWGRRGAAYPGGEVGISIQNQLCNPGTIPVEWREPGGNIGSTIQSDHPKFGFLVCKEVNGRFVQISDASYCKHAFYALASPSTCGGTCQPPAVAGTQLGVSCSDIYSASNNASRTYLGPPMEINPWLGTWPSTGNYFDVGDPANAGYPLPADGLRSLSTSGWDAVKNRVTLREADITNGATMYYQVHVVIEGERIENRNNNTMSRPFSMTYAGGSGQSAWNSTTLGTATLGTILTQWTGATLGEGTNGGTFTHLDADGRFQVAVKVTGPVNGFWHYEYAVLNIDNHRGGASFKLPVCPTGRVQNIGFRDIDQNALNNWTASVAGGFITWSDTNNNPHNWNTVYNFYFDSDVGPTSGTAVIDQARVGPGALFVNVPTTVPGLQTAVWLGAGCGAPATNLFANGQATAGNAGYQLHLTSDPNTPMLLVFSSTSSLTNLAPGCDAYVDLLNYSVVDLYLTNGAGLAVVPAPLAPGVLPIDLTVQAASFNPAPPVLGLFGLSNGLTVRVAGTGCQ